MAAKRYVSEAFRFCTASASWRLILPQRHVSTRFANSSSFFLYSLFYADHNVIVQRILVDGTLLAVFIFQVERTAGLNGPSAELMDFSKRRPAATGTASRPSSQSFPSPSAAPPIPPTTSHPLGYPTSSSGYAFSTVPQLSALSQPVGERMGPGSHRSALDTRSGLLGTTATPGRMYYPPS